MANEFEALSQDFLKWLVKSRSDNQLASLRLYEVVKAEQDTGLFRNNPDLFAGAQELTGIAFSLWRAVFLNDLTDEYERQSANLESFLKNLIAHNSIQYMTDFNSREWSFWYYLNNATYRLEHFADQIVEGVVPETLIDRKGSTARERWENAEAAFEQSVENFQAIIASRRSDGDHPPN